MNKVRHFEIPTDDIKRAGDFYSKVFGWKIEDTSIVDEMKYHMAYTTEIGDDYMPKEVGVINGGFYERMKDEGPTIMISVDEMDKALEKVREAGGAVVAEPKHVGEMGIYARVKDSEGNVVGVWEDLKGKK